MDASPSTNSNSNYNFEVFINHHGKDVKNTLASHLYYRLRDRNFRVFLDRPEMQAGDDLTCQIKGAIGTASVHIAIFSPRYAKSKWCLDELVQMHDQMQKLEATVIPIFYNVNPCDLRIRTDDRQHGLLGQILRFIGCAAGNNGVYGKALRGHEKKRRYSQQRIADWKKALLEVSHLSGLELKAYYGDEGKLLESVVQLVEEKIRKPQLFVAEYPTGLDEKLQDFEKTVMLQQRHSGETKVVGIVGSGGVGKTTLALEFFNRNRSAYRGSCFLEDVRAETSLISVQNKLLQGLTSRDLTVSNIVEGKSELSRRLLGYKALVILDDINDSGQLKALFSPLKDILSSDSLILLTSRNRDFLSTNGVSLIYKLSGLDREQSQRLFCMHAFQEPEPRAGFEEEVAKFLDACDGLPLSLRVLGSHLYKKDLEYWEAQLLKLSGLVLPPEIQNSLRISYDSLDTQEREIFLDIACFFIEEDKDLAISIWDGSGWGGKLNLQNLEYKCILEIDCQNRIKMHNHLRDLGRDFADRELPRCHRRLWRPTDGLFRNAVIQPNVRGINRVQGIPDQSFHNSLQPYVDMSTLHLLRAEGDCLKSISEFLKQADQLLWLCWSKCPDTSLPSCLRIRNLRALQMTGGELETWCHSESVRQPDYGGDSGEVKHIRLNGCSRSELLLCCPLNLLHLEHLDLQGTKIKEVSFAEGFCPTLKHLNISFCRELMEVAGLPRALISLNLQGSTALKKISGLPGLANLRLLDISGCNEIEELPGHDTLPSLDEVNGISECKKLKIRI